MEDLFNIPQFVEARKTLYRGSAIDIDTVELSANMRKEILDLGFKIMEADQREILNDRLSDIVQLLRNMR